MKLLGWVEHTECECCGRRDLTRALAVLTDDGEVMHFGSDCARRSLGMASSRDLSTALKTEAARLQSLRSQHASIMNATAASKEAAQIIEASRAARLPFNERPARINELKAEAMRIADARFTAHDLEAMRNYGQNPGAYA